MEPRPRARRYEYAMPAELLHLEIKKLGRFRRPGHSVIGNRQRAPDGAGWDFVHVAIECRIAVAFGIVLPDERSISIYTLLLRTVRHYRGLGVRFAWVMTDNGSYPFRRLLQRLGLRHIRTRPISRRPTTRPSASFQTLRERAYDRHYDTAISALTCLEHLL